MFYNLNKALMQRRLKDARLTQIPTRNICANLHFLIWAHLRIYNPYFVDKAQ